VRDARLLLVFTHSRATDNDQWLSATDAKLRPSLGRVGVFDDEVELGTATSRIATSTASTVCGATALAAVLRPAP
jgi:hypothetical protein